MFIKNCLTAIDQLVVLNVNTTIKDALQKMNKSKLLSLPVADDKNRFCGLLTKSGLFSLWEKADNEGEWDDFLNLKISEAIHSEIPVLTLEDVFEKTLPIIVRYPFVPIVDETNVLLGIVKRSEISQSLQTAFGMNVPGIRLLLGMVETDGQLDKIVDITRHLNIPIITSITFDAGDTYLRRVLLKVPMTTNHVKLLDTLEANGIRVLTTHEVN